MLGGISLGIPRRTNPAKTQYSLDISALETHGNRPKCHSCDTEGVKLLARHSDGAVAGEFRGAPQLRRGNPPTSHEERTTWLHRAQREPVGSRAYPNHNGGTEDTDNTHSTGTPVYTSFG